jgi:hypothetical protein
MRYEDQLLQNLTADGDYRTTAIDDRWWSAIRGSEALYQPYDDEPKRWVKVTFVVCPACEGKGKYVNPSIDAHGLTAEDFDEGGDDFREMYWSGQLDVRCVLCEGNNVVPVPNDQSVLAEITERANDLYQMRNEQLAEMRMGA